MKPVMAASVACSCSRCGECLQSLRTSRSKGPATPRSIASICASVPYSSSAPWIASITAARRAYDTEGLRQRLARFHADVDGAFSGWNDIWLHPAFRDWNIEAYLAGIACPVLAIQGADDEYGTVKQLEAIERGVKGKFERLVLRNCKHSPHRDQEAIVLEAMAGFAERVSAAG